MSKQIHLVNEIVDQLLTDNKNKIIAIGVFGSGAKKEYIPFSDIDLILITNVKINNKFFIYKHDGQDNSLKIGEDIKISIFSKTKSQAIKAVLNLNNLTWSTDAGMFLNVLAVYDPKKVFAGLLSEYNKIKTEPLEHTEFKNLAGRWLSIAYEFLAKINVHDIPLELTKIYGKEFCFCIANFIKATNMDFFINIYRFIDECGQSRLKPQNCHILMRKIINSCQTKITTSAVKKLWENSVRMAKEQNIFMSVCVKNQVKEELNTLFYDEK